MPAENFIVVPSVSSERRLYIPIGFMTPDTMISNLCNVVSVNSLFHFGLLTSAMHMAWVRQVCGRLKSDYRYSVKLVYNNYPWPEAPSDKRKAAVKAKAQAVLDARLAHPDSTLADLYHPLTMPVTLTRAHAALDRAVDACYRAKAFDSERERVEFLFGLYEKLTAPLTGGLKEPKRRRQR